MGTIAQYRTSIIAFTLAVGLLAATFAVVSTAEAQTEYPNASWSGDTLTMQWTDHWVSDCANDYYLNGVNHGELPGGPRANMSEVGPNPDNASEVICQWQSRVSYQERAELPSRVRVYDESSRWKLLAEIAIPPYTGPPPTTCVAPGAPVFEQGEDGTVTQFAKYNSTEKRWEYERDPSGFVYEPDEVRLPAHYTWVAYHVRFDSPGNEEFSGWRVYGCERE